MINKSHKHNLNIVLFNIQPSNANILLKPLSFISYYYIISFNVDMHHINAKWNNHNIASLPHFVLTLTTQNEI